MKTKAPDRRRRVDVQTLVLSADANDVIARCQVADRHRSVREDLELSPGPVIYLDGDVEIPRLGQRLEALHTTHLQHQVSPVTKVLLALGDHRVRGDSVRPVMQNAFLRAKPEISPGTGDQGLDMEFTLYIYPTQMEIVRQAQRAGSMSWYASAEFTTRLPYSREENEIRLGADFEE